MRNTIVLLMLPLLAGAAALPPTTNARPSSGPASAPAAPATPPDLSSPKAAARSLFRAITAGDRGGVRESFHAEGRNQRALTAAMADLIVAGKQLGDAARQKYGSAGDPIGRGMLDPADLAKLDAATEKRTSDATATLEVPGQPRPMSFRKSPQDQKWRLVVTDYAAAGGGAAGAGAGASGAGGASGGGASGGAAAAGGGGAAGAGAADSVAKQTRLVTSMARAIETAAAEIAADKYKTADEATHAIQQSLHQVMLSFYRPPGGATTRAGAAATGPATRPGGQ